MHSLPNAWRSLLAAPHRMFFASGLLWLIAFSAWWAIVLAGRAAGIGLETPVPSVYVHGAAMLYLAFTPFILGFLFTVFPRWMPAPPPGRRTELCVFALINAGNAVTLAGLYTAPAIVALGISFSTVGLAVAGTALARCMLASPEPVMHAPPAVAALLTGAIGMAAFVYCVASGDYGPWPVVRAIGLWGFLLPVYFTVCHRMVPFFTSRIFPEYRPWRPGTVLAAFTGLAFLRTVLETVPDWRWVATVPMAALALLCAWRWHPKKAGGPALLATLHGALAILVLSLLFAASSDLSTVAGIPGVPERASLHALGAGFFGTMLVAMVTRVTMGHSGRPLAMDQATLTLFFLVAAAATIRVVAEWSSAPALSMAAALVWLGAFAGFAARHATTWTRPRVDGRPG